MVFINDGGATFRFNGGQLFQLSVLFCAVTASFNSELDQAIPGRNSLTPHATKLVNDMVDTCEETFLHKDLSSSQVIKQQFENPLGFSGRKKVLRRPFVFSL